MSGFGTGSQSGDAGELTLLEESLVENLQNLSPVSGNFIVGNGLDWTTESNSLYILADGTKAIQP